MNDENKSKLQFKVADYCQTNFENESFTVIWALESVCYALNKKDFLAEAYRLLKPGGRLILADGFANKSEFSKDEKTIMDAWVKNWAVHELAEIESFKNSAQEVGFDLNFSQNISANIMHSSKRLYRFSLLNKMARSFRKMVGKPYKNKHATNNGIGAYYQYIGLKKKLWSYYIISAKKEI